MSQEKLFLPWSVPSDKPLEQWVMSVNSISTTSTVDNGLSWSVRLCNKPHNKAATKAQSIH